MENAIRMKVEKEKEKKNFFRIKSVDAFLICLVVIIPGLISLSSASKYSSSKQTFNWSPYYGDSQSEKEGFSTLTGYGYSYWKAMDSTFNATLVSGTGTDYLTFLFTLGTTMLPGSTIDVTHRRNGVTTHWSASMFLVGYSSFSVSPSFVMVDAKKSTYMINSMHPFIQVSGDTQGGTYTIKLNLALATIKFYFAPTSC